MGDEQDKFFNICRKVFCYKVEIYRASYSCDNTSWSADGVELILKNQYISQVWGYGYRIAAQMPPIIEIAEKTIRLTYVAGISERELEVFQTSVSNNVRKLSYKDTAGSYWFYYVYRKPVA